jgi:hypothetical protein
MVTYLPNEWPTGVHPPGSEEFERTAVAWLLDVVPPDYRLHGVLQRHPVALATMARHHLAACVEGARQGYRTARTELGGVLPVSGLDAVLAAYRSEGQRLVAAAHAADLVERALRGKEFTPPLEDPPGQHGRPEQQAPPGGQQQGAAGEPQPLAPEKQQAAGGKRQPLAPGKQQAVAGKLQKPPAPAKHRQKQPVAAAKQRRG